jgi:hypothetical protein
MKRGAAKPRMRPALLAGVVAVLMALGFAAPASAEIDVAGWEFKELTSQDVHLGFNLAFDSEHVALPKLSDSDGPWDLFLLDLATGAETRITDSPEGEYGVALDGSHLAWVSRNEGDADSGVLRLRDLETGTTTTIAQGMIMWEDRVQIVGDHVAWTQLERVPGTDALQRGLYLYTISTGATVRVTDAAANVSSGSGGNQAFDLSEMHIAWIKDGQASALPEVWLYDIQEATADMLGVTTEGLAHVSLEADLVTWAAPAGSGPAPFYAPSDIFLHRISTGITEKIATVKTPEPYPKTDGRFVVGDDYPGDSTQSRRVIWAYDADTGRHIDVSANQFLNFTPEISGGLVVWERGGELESEIMAHDLLTGQTTQLSSNRTWMDQLALVNDRTVVWWKHWFSMETGVPEPPDRLMMATAPSSFVDPFADVPGQHRFRTAILGIDERGIANGYQVAAGRHFRPEAPLLRAQFAKMICEAFDVPVTEELVAPFTDMGPDDPANLYPHEYVAALAALGIVQGKAPGRFDPYGPLTRGQAVSMLVRALDAIYPGLVTVAQAEAPGAYYWDPPHRTNLRRAYANDLLASLIDWMQRWGAYDPCNRGEAAQMIWNALSLLEQEGRG